MKGMGHAFNTIPVASGKHVSLADARGVTFVIYEDGGATEIALKESKAGSGEQNLAVIDDYLASDGVGGVWTRETDDADGPNAGAASMVKKDTTNFDCAAIYVDASQLSAGFDSVECTVDGGVCVAIVHGLHVQRDPVNLPASAV
jgi:hypothetical protein